MSAHLRTDLDRSLTLKYNEGYSFHSVQTRTYTLESCAGTIEGQRFYDDMSRVFRTPLPFLRKWVRVPDDYEEIYQQALYEMQQPDFVQRGRLLTVWGTKKR